MKRCAAQPQCTHIYPNQTNKRHKTFRESNNYFIYFLVSSEISCLISKIISNISRYLRISD